MDRARAGYRDIDRPGLMDMEPGDHVCNMACWQPYGHRGGTMGTEGPVCPSAQPLVFASPLAVLSSLYDLSRCTILCTVRNATPKLLSMIQMRFSTSFMLHHQIHDALSHLRQLWLSNCRWNCTKRHFPGLRAPAAAEPGIGPPAYFKAALGNAPGAGPRCGYSARARV